MTPGARVRPTCPHPSWLLRRWGGDRRGLSVTPAVWVRLYSAETAESETVHTEQYMRNSFSCTCIIYLQYKEEATQPATPEQERGTVEARGPRTEQCEEMKHVWTLPLLGSPYKNHAQMHYIRRAVAVYCNLLGVICLVQPTPYTAGSSLTHPTLQPAPP